MFARGSTLASFSDINSTYKVCVTMRETALSPKLQPLRNKFLSSEASPLEMMAKQLPYSGGKL